MANKGLATRQKMQLRVIPAPKPRNPLAVAAKQRVAGAHVKTKSAQRQADKRALQKTDPKKSEDE
jgi:hypothetical protein